MTAGNDAAKAATSASPVDQPTEQRSERSAAAPIAASTGEGSRVSEEHADPEWTATPAASSPRTTPSASTPGTPKQAMCGRRLPGSP